MPYFSSKASVKKRLNRRLAFMREVMEWVCYYSERGS